MTASHDHVVSGLIDKRRELAGIIDELQHQLDQHRADLTHIDGVLRVLAIDLDPETIRPKRAYRRNRYFARNELSRLCLGVLRTKRDEQHRGFRGMSDAEVREAVESAIQDAGDCRCWRFG
jgi:hypothetical protein